MAEISYVNPPGAPPAQGLYTHVGVWKGGGHHAFIAGQLSVDGEGALVGRNDFAAQFKQSFANLQAVLKGLGADYSNVIKFTTYLVRSQDIDAFMALRSEYFPRFFENGVYPPNTLLVVDRLVKEDFLFEIEAVAAV